MNHQFPDLVKILPLRVFLEFFFMNMDLNHVKDDSFLLFFNKKNWVFGICLYVNLVVHEFIGFGCFLLFALDLPICFDYICPLLWNL